jgi:hypothetical protein
VAGKQPKVQLRSEHKRRGRRKRRRRRSKKEEEKKKKNQFVQTLTVRQKNLDLISRHLRGFGEGCIPA